MSPSFMQAILFGLFLASIVLFHYLFVHFLAREPVDWVNPLKQGIRIMLGITGYVGVIWFINTTNLVEIDGLALLFYIWPILVVGYGIRKVKANQDENNVSFGRLLVFFGLVFCLPYIELLVTKGESSGQLIYAVGGVVLVLFWPVVIGCIVVSLASHLKISSSERKRPSLFPT